jgi:post-segregation antitoxin (ccd killing protein)
MKSMSTDGDAGIATQTRTITISAQPQSASRANAASVTFSVTASVSPATSSTLAYQWQVNTGSAYADITGATSAAYTKTVATAENGYLFRAVVSTDGATPVTSDAATLTVTA